MSDLRSRLDDTAQTFTPTQGWLAGAIRRGSRRRRNRRVTSAVVALALSAATSLMIWRLVGDGPPRAAIAPPCPRSWHDVPTESPPGGMLSVASTNGPETWAVGPDQGAPPGSSAIANHWDSTAWHTVRLPDPATGTDSVSILNDVVSVSDSDAWAVGEYVDGGWDSGNAAMSLAMHWDGKTWTIVPTPSPSDSETTLNAVAAVAPDDVWAVGFEVEGGRGRPLAEHWDGESWVTVPTPDSFGLYAVDANAPGDVWAGGSQQSGGLIQHWDGDRWTIVDIPQLGGGILVTSLDAVAPDDVWAAGWTTEPRGSGANAPSVNVAVVLHFDGTRWALTKLPVAPDEQSVAVAVTASTDGAWVGGWTGEVVSFGSRSTPHPAMWSFDGSTWRYDGSRRAAEGIITGAATVGSDVWFVGRQGGESDNNGYIHGDSPLVLVGTCG